VGTLGNLFPEDKKREYIDRNFQPGQVLYLYCEFISPQKDKFLVLICDSEIPLLFFINSNIGPYVANRPDLQNCQVPLRAKDYGFLDHDSFINCGEVVNYFDRQTIYHQLLDDTGRIVGELNEATKNQIVRVVKKARLISNRHKKMIIKALTAR
jgi:hypothetical protein